MTSRYTRGWFQVAFERELVEEVSPCSVGTRRMILIKDADRVRAFDADCPHRGAHLGVGGCVEGDTIRCPFHHYRIRLGGADRGGFFVREYPVLMTGGMVCVRLSEGDDHGWPSYLEGLAASYHFINGFEMTIRARAEAVIENAFDRLHFQAVHGVATEAFEVRAGPAGELIAESLFHVPTRGTGGVMPTPYRAVVISPGLAMVELRGWMPYTIITAATDAPDGGCSIRLTLCLPRSVFPDGPPPAVYEPLLAHSRRGLEDDRVIWENLSPSIVPSWTNDDRGSLEFFRFCETFADG